MSQPSGAHPYADKFPMLPPPPYGLVGTTKDRMTRVSILHSVAHPGFYDVIGIDSRRGKTFQTNKPCNDRDVIQTILRSELGDIDLVWKTDKADLMPCKKHEQQDKRVPKVYFIQDEDGYIKIGYSENVDKRIAGLQTSSRQKLTLLGAVRGDQSLEALYHRVFKSDRVRGEWFYPSQRLLRMIEEELADVYSSSSR